MRTQGGNSMKKRIFNIIAVVIMCIVFFILGFSFEKSRQPKALTDIKQSQMQSEPLNISFDEYLRLFNEFQTLSFPEYHLNTDISFLSPSVRAIEPDLSFGKRQFLTVDGEMDFDDDTSTERVLYFDSNQKRFAISLIYTETNIGNDFLGSDWLAFTEENLSNSFLISFHNVLILTTLEGTQPLDFNEINEIHSIIIEKLDTL